MRGWVQIGDVMAELWMNCEADAGCQTINELGRLLSIILEVFDVVSLPFEVLKYLNIF